ncbi:MAG: hypothetical protein Q7N95_05775 [Alphaproteobacteria bacterium]|nr:hypothetical protein [Alphaproteobacteria bacterium]
MTSIQGSTSMAIGISIAGAKPLHLPPPVHANELFKDNPELLAQMKLRDSLEVNTSKKPAGGISSEQIAAIAAKNADKTHSVFRVDGKIVGIIGENAPATTTFANPATINAFHAAQTKLMRNHLSDGAYRDTFSKLAEDDLQQQYGARLTVTRYDAATAPIRAEFEGELFSLKVGDMLDIST